MATLKDDIKLALGDLASNKFDGTINNFINAGKKDLEEAGIVATKIVETDALIYSALFYFVLGMIDTYDCRELAQNTYALQKNQLRHYQDYIS